MAAAPILEVVGVSKSFLIPDVRRNTLREQVLDFLRPRHVHPFTAVDNVSLTVAPGTALGIMGRNGCGKSTLLKLIAGIYEPDSGRVTRRGRLTPILELGVGWNPELDAIDNILLVGSVMGLPLAELKASTPEILAFAEVEAFANLKLQHYSSGMAARLAYAVAFAAVKEILVLDEILAVGDAGFRARCEHRYRALRAQGVTVVLVSHDPAATATFCDQAALMDAGRIVFAGAPGEVVERYLATLAPEGAQRDTDDRV